MDLVQVKDILFEVTDRFFQGAPVIWTEQNAPRQKVPYVTMKVSGLERRAFPVNDDGDVAYHCSTTLEVNICTNGMPVVIEENVTGNFVNTAMSDMAEYANYFESEGTVDFLGDYGIDVSLMPPIRDLTSLENDCAYRYRAMAEFTVTFVMDASGRYGILNVSLVPNSSGGGTRDLADTLEQPIDNIEIN